MKEKIYQWTIPILALVILVGLIIYEQSMRNNLLAGVGDTHRIPSVITTTTVAPTLTGGILNPVASSTLLLRANDDRRYARCTNIGTNAQAYPVSIVLGANSTLGYGATSTTNFYGIVLGVPASTTPNFFEINNANNFTGAVYASSLGTSTVTCIEN